MASVAQWVGVLSQQPKGCGFDPSSGHMPGLQGVFKMQLINVSRSKRCFSTLLSLSHPLSLKINKQFLQ